MPTPSLLIVPARFKSGKLYSQIPTSGAGDFTVTRATAATRVNASGLIESVASGIPRLDYYTSGGTAGCPALLVEPSGTNLAWHSEIWASGNNWTLDRLTIVTGTNATLDPFGTNLANAISPNSLSASHLTQSNSTSQITYASGTVYTQTAFLKQGVGDAGRYAQLTFSALRFTQSGYVNFDLQLGTIAVVSGSAADTNRAASIENYGNGWYRCRFTATCNNAGLGAGVSLILITSSGSTRVPTFTGVTGDVLYGFGAQVETGSVATSYIPTTTGSITRNADVVSVSGAVSGCIGQTEGTIYAEVDLRNFVTNARILSIDNGVVDNRIEFRINTSNRIRVLGDSAGSTFVDISSLTNQPQGIYKIAFGYANNDFVFYINGSQIGTDTSGSVPSTNQIHIGSAYSNTQQLSDRIRSVALYTTRLTNDQLAALTTP